MPSSTVKLLDLTSLTNLEDAIVSAIHSPLVPTQLPRDRYPDLI
jgi:hypothetical protein